MSLLSFVSSHRTHVACLALVAVAFLLIVSVGRNASANIFGSVQPWRHAEIQGTYYHLNNSVHGERRSYNEPYIAHLDEYFNLQTREVGEHLQVLVHIPHSMSYTNDLGDTGTMHFDFASDKSFYYNTVRQPSDCTSELFANHFNMQITEPRTSMSLPLAASDYGRYYCFKVRLSVNQPGWDRRPHRIFVAPISIRNAGSENLSNYPNHARSITQSTYYSYYGNYWGSHENPDPEQESYYRHLNNHFNLYTSQAAGQLNVQIVLPGYYAISGQTDITSFELLKIEYVPLDISNRASCDRPLFDGNEVETVAEPTLAFSFDVDDADYGTSYCVKVSIRGERSWARDVHPYRIFLAQPVSSESVDPGAVWDSL